jgi:hypothetical protein
MEPVVRHQHTYFFFPFSIDREQVLEQQAPLWKGRPWIDGLDDWLAAARDHAPPLIGPWKRAAYTTFDMESRAYQDMVFFHPFVRRIYFDTAGIGQNGEGTEPEPMLRCYQIPVPEGATLRLEAEDARGRSAVVDVTDLRLFLFANGIGILSIGVEATRVPASRALWINEMLRKVYPSSGRQMREGRVPNRLGLTIERSGNRLLILEERFSSCTIKAYLPPMSRLITALLYFCDYAGQDYEPVLDERMIVYSYLSLDPASVPPDYKDSEAYRILLSRALYVDNWGKDYRYERSFTRDLMARQTYDRWSHQGTWYGFTSYSAITLSFGAFDCDDHLLKEGFLIHRMFESRYYLMALIALFYRATLLDFAERTALVSLRLHADFGDGKLNQDNVELAGDLRSEFLNFSNYWHFEELANKDEESEHFHLQCRAYRISSTKAEIETEVERMNSVLDTHYQRRNTNAVNRLAVLSTILGAGAVATGFFGMNFGGWFGKLLFDPVGVPSVLHYLSILLVTFVGLGAVALGALLIALNWHDYRDALAFRRTDIRKVASIRRVE